jgi:hypothetical protein
MYENLSIDFILKAFEDQISLGILKLFNLLLLLNLIVCVCFTHVMSVFPLVEHVSTQSQNCVPVSY